MILILNYPEVLTISGYIVVFGLGREVPRLNSSSVITIINSLNTSGYLLIPFQN